MALTDSSPASVLLPVTPSLMSPEPLPLSLGQDPDRAEILLRGDAPHKGKHQAAITVGTMLGTPILLGAHRNVLISFKIKRKKQIFRQKKTF